MHLVSHITMSVGLYLHPSKYEIFDGAWRVVSTVSAGYLPFGSLGIFQLYELGVHRYSQVLIKNYSLMGPLLPAFRAAVHYPAYQELWLLYT